MFGIRYLKAPPTAYVIQYADGKARREGAGLSFFYYSPSSTLVLVPLASADVPFAFNEVTADFQTVTIQGQVTFRVAEPRRAAGLLDFTVRPDGTYRTDDPDKIAERLVHAAQVLARGVVGAMALRDALTGAERVAAEVLPSLRKAEAVVRMGVEILDLSVLSVKTAPETVRALEAEAREALLRNADEAIYARRNAAVEQERLIKENELQTEVAVEEQKRKIRETQMAADIAVEDQRGDLIDRRSENERKDADARAYALDATIRPVRDMDWKTLLAVGAGGNDPALMIALAFRELAENAGKIGELNVTPDLLKTLAARSGRRDV